MNKLYITKIKLHAQFGLLIFPLNNTKQTNPSAIKLKNGVIFTCTLDSPFPVGNYLIKQHHNICGFILTNEDYWRFLKPQNAKNIVDRRNEPYTHTYLHLE